MTPRGITRAHCAGTTNRGTPCQARPVAGTDYCVRHATDPAIRAKARAGSSKGGKEFHRRTQTPPGGPLDLSGLDLETPAGLQGAVARTLSRLGSLPFDVRVANAIGQLVNVARATLETAELEQRITALERRAVSRVA